MEVGYLCLTGGLREFCTHIYLLAQLQGESGQTCIYLNAINSYFLPILCSYFLFLFSWSYLYSCFALEDRLWLSQWFSKGGT